MALDPALERPRTSSDPTFSDAVTCAFADRAAGVQGTVRIGVAGGAASGLVLVFADGEPVLSHAEGAIPIPPDPEGYGDLSAAGIDHEIVEPHRRWSVSAATDDAALDLSFVATGPPLVLEGDHVTAKWGGMEGYEQPCRVTGTLTVGDRRFRIDGVGQRGHQWGAPDWTRLELARTVTGWFDGDLSFAVSALRPAGSASHADELAWAAVARVPPPGEDGASDAGAAGEPQAVLAPEPRISTTTDDGGRHTLATVELWESDEGPVWTATGEAISGTTLELGRLRLDTAFFRWRLAGREGVGRYDVLKKVADAPAG
ncbi:DUF7065 domain-containing protein [Patulibacter defluvii]|uniref:DUF7065 domain-containing protein n=1 Tax=Patulibacter defluvii TaxID=3095358 RepID=UPI002A75463B|nr:hypothetical protein [Patulibacter sp. DM4]